MSARGDSMSEHSHSHQANVAKLDKVKSVPGVIYVKRDMHDEATVISGSLTIVTASPLMSEILAKELEAAGREITELGGIIGHIKGTCVETTTKMISVTEEHAMTKEAAERSIRIILAAIVFLVDKEAAGDIIKQALTRVRAQSREPRA